MHLLRKVEIQNRSEISVPVGKGEQRTGTPEGGLWGRKHQATQKTRWGAEKTGGEGLILILDSPGHKC